MDDIPWYGFLRSQKPHIGCLNGHKKEAGSDYPHFPNNLPSFLLGHYGGRQQEAEAAGL